MQPVAITGFAAITAAGPNLQSTINTLHSGKSCLEIYGEHICARLDPEGEDDLGTLGAEKPLRHADRAVQLGVLSARQATNGVRLDPAVGVVFGSSRGATQTLERELGKFVRDADIALTTSPASTSGSFASTISKDLELSGLSIFVSSACSTAMQAIGVACGLINSGMLEGVLVGASEASVTPFTLAQLKKLGIYGRSTDARHPYRPFHPDRNGMMLGEGAGCLVLEKSRGHRQGGSLRILGFGACQERGSLTGISERGEGLSKAIALALDDAGIESTAVDLIVTHGAGTKKGDAAELRAYEKTFGVHLANITQTNHKWCFGHLLGAAAAVSTALTCEHLLNGRVPKIPYLDGILHRRLAGSRGAQDGPQIALVASLGFGGSAACIILERA